MIEQRSIIDHRYSSFETTGSSVMDLLLLNNQFECLNYYNKSSVVHWCSRQIQDQSDVKFSLHLKEIFFQWFSSTRSFLTLSMHDIQNYHYKENRIHRSTWNEENDSIVSSRPIWILLFSREINDENAYAWPRWHNDWFFFITYQTESFMMKTKVNYEDEWTWHNSSDLSMRVCVCK